MVFKKLNFKNILPRIFQVPLCWKDQAQSVFFTVANLSSLHSTDIKSKEHTLLLCKSVPGLSNYLNCLVNSFYLFIFHFYFLFMTSFILIYYGFGRESARAILTKSFHTTWSSIAFISLVVAAQSGQVSLYSVNVCSSCFTSIWVTMLGFHLKQ